MNIEGNKKGSDETLMSVKNTHSDVERAGEDLHTMLISFI